MKIKKSDLLSMIQEQNDVIAKLIRQVNCQHKDIIRIEGVIEPEPQLKQLDQSVFSNIHERWRFAAVDKCGEAYVYVSEPESGSAYFVGGNGTDYRLFGQGYDASNWQDSLIERDIAKELTGSDLARAMLARGDRWILCGNTTDGFASPCIIDGYRRSEDDLGFILTNGKSIEPRYIYPVNNQGEPLTASEAGL